MTSVRRVLDRIADGALGPALTRPVAASLRRDALAALRNERPADAVLERSLAHLEVAAAGTSEVPNTGAVGAGDRKAPSGWRAGQLPATSPPAAVARRQLVETSHGAVPTMSDRSAAQLGPPLPPPALRVLQLPGTEIAEGDAANHQSPATVTAGAAPRPLAERKVADDRATDGTTTSAARQAVVAPAAVLGRDALERLVHPPAVLALAKDRSSTASISPTPTKAMSSVLTAAATPLTREAPLADGRRRPSGLADLAAMYSSTDPPDSVARADDIAPPLGIDPPDLRGELAITVQDEAAQSPAGDWRLRDSRSRTSPSPAAELSGVAAVLEAVLLHEARRYGVSVEET